MSGPDARKGRPRQDAPIKIAPPPSLVPVDDPRDELARVVRGTFVVVVEVSGGKYRRRCFMTVASAERAARNAQAAGHNARIYLSELRPLWRLSSDEVAS